jgi:hypothetical protein
VNGHKLLGATHFILGKNTFAYENVGIWPWRFIYCMPFYLMIVCNLFNKFVKVHGFNSLKKCIERGEDAMTCKVPKLCISW